MQAEKNEDLYRATCLYGLEEDLALEVQERLNVPTENHWSEVLFTFGGNPAALRELRLANNIHLRAAEFEVGSGPEAVEAVAERLAELPVEHWLQCRERFNSRPAEADRVIVSVSRRGDHSYTYKDVEEAAVNVIEGTFGRRAALEGEGPKLEIEIQGDHCRVLCALTEASLARRPWKVRHTRAETHAAIAAAMIARSEPDAADCFLDPYCGSGTIPIERAIAHRARRVVAGDSKEKYVNYTRTNAGAVGVPVETGVWDALHLPFEDRQFTAIATEPPLGNPEDGRPWSASRYSGLMREMLRVLEFGCPLVILMRSEKLLKAALRPIPYTRITHSLLCDWKGKRHVIATVRRMP